MADLTMKIVNASGEVLKEAHGEEINLYYDKAYQPGDGIILEGVTEGTYLWLQWDDALGKSLVYVTGNVKYQIPFGEKRLNISPKAFSGERHLLTVSVAMDFEISAYRNLALNVCDQHDIEHLYPHAVANVETRGESVFAAQNAIDGVTANASHGEWPYESWGINRQDDAKIRIDFGREVCVDRILLYTRADFPHDNWWKEVSFTCSDGSSMKLAMEKSDRPHELSFEEKKISWIEMHDMIKADDPSPFPALSQIKVFGKTCVE